MPLRRTGSLFGLLGLELGAVLGLHWLGRFPGLRVGWDDPVPWLLSSPVQEVLGALLRTVGLVMAYWLLASTVLYLLASLTRLPAAVRAVSWATLPLARRVADHAVAVTLATSMVGGSTLGVAGPALAADSRGPGPLARTPVVAAQQPTDTTVYGFDEAGPGAADQTTSSTDETTSSTSASTTTTTTEPPATVPPTTPTTQPATTPTTQPATTPTTQPATTVTTEPATTTSRAARAAPPAYTFEDAGRGAPPPPSTTAPASTAAPTTSTAGLRPPAYEFITPAEAQEAREAADDAGSGGGGGNEGGDDQSGGGGDDQSGGGGSGGGNESGGGGESGNGGGSGNSGSGGEERSGTQQERPYTVRPGDNLWTIARDHLRGARSGGSGEPTNREVAEYWAKVVQANRHGLRSGDPDLIYPDERIELPPAD